MTSRNTMLLAVLFLVSAVLVAACDEGPTGPTSRYITVSSIRYERVRPSKALPGVERLYLQMNRPYLDDPQSRSDINFCLPRTLSDQVFVCENVGWTIPIGVETWVQAVDPVVGMVAETIYVNDQRIERIQVLGNGIELGRFRFNKLGQLR